MNSKKKFILFRRSENFCSAPWNLLYVGTSGEIRTCSRGETLGNLHHTDLDNILNQPSACRIKTGIANNEIVDNCSYCISMENSGNNKNHYGYLRSMYNELFVDQLVNYDNAHEFQLGAVDLHWSSLCDLKCVTCWAKQSSSLAVEQGLPVQHTKTEVALKVIDFIVNNQHTLREVYLSGGEPTLIKYNLNLLQRLKKTSNLLLRVNSNMMWAQDNAIIQEILKFPRVLFTCSADNVESKFEYIRRGAQWARFVENLKYLKGFDNVDLRVNSVFFVLSALDLSRTIDYFHDHHGIVNFTINPCEMDHSDLRCRNLSDSNKKLTIEQLESTKEKYHHNLNLVGAINNCLIELAEPKTECYRAYLDQSDQQSGRDWKIYFSELK